MSVVVKNIYTGKYDTVGIHRLDPFDDRNYYTDNYSMSNLNNISDEYIPFYKSLKNFYKEENDLTYKTLYNFNITDYNILSNELESNSSYSSYDETNKSSKNDEELNKSDEESELELFKHSRNKFFYT